MSSLDTSALLVVITAVAIDMTLGEMPNRIHPVVGMGTLTHWLLRRAPVRAALQFAFGILLVTLVVAATLCATVLARLAIEHAGTIANGVLPPSFAWVVIGGRIAAEALLLSTLFALRALLTAGVRMRRALNESVDAGRKALLHLCSRDPSTLGKCGLAGATIESLAENTSDSFIAPLFWYVVGEQCGGWGLCAAATYRAVNTLDAMVGYRGKYEYIGKAAARLDDVLNWMPARLTAAFFALGAQLGARAFGFNSRQAARIAWRDHHLTASPNAGWPMAAAAGALDVELVKHEHYVLGAGSKEPTSNAVARCERLVLLTAGAGLAGLMLYTLSVNLLCASETFHGEPTRAALSPQDPGVRTEVACSWCSATVGGYRD